ncbi:MAG: hypothetical protein K6T85_12005 [Gorillibacterium sp.]|nr:hypothetical protein [Gorillibacterium sp.]
MAKANAKKNELPSIKDKYRFNMKIVTSDTCLVCKQKCLRGIRYMESLAVPGAIGRGVPCILTKGRAFK